MSSAKAHRICPHPHRNLKSWQKLTWSQVSSNRKIQQRSQMYESQNHRLVRTEAFWVCPKEDESDVGRAFHKNGTFSDLQDQSYMEIHSQKMNCVCDFVLNQVLLYAVSTLYSKVGFSLYKSAAWGFPWHKWLFFMKPNPSLQSPPRRVSFKETFQDKSSRILRL